MFSLGQRIKELRMKMGFTQIELAQGICTPSMVSQIESDRAKPSYKILYKLAERLEVPLEKLLSDIEMNLEYVSSYKMAKAMVTAKEYVAAIPLLKEVLATRRTVLSKATIQYDLAECYVHSGELTEAEELLNEVQDVAILRQDIHMIAQTYQLLAEIAVKRKRFQLCIHLMRKALDEVEKMEPTDIYMKAGILIQLGNAHESLGLLQDSVHYYEEASYVFENLGNFDDIAKTYLKLGQSYKKLNDVEKATEYSERAISIFAAIDNVYTGILAQVHTATVYGKTGREKKRFRCCNKPFKNLGNSGSVKTWGLPMCIWQKCNSAWGMLMKRKTPAV